MDSAQGASWEEGLTAGKAEGLAEGKAEGLAEGKAEGEKNKAIKIAHNCIKQEMDNDIIAQITGLMIAEIEDLRQP